MSASPPGRVALVTLGCPRNDVDSEQLAGQLLADGWTLVDDPADADVAVVNTCGFIEAAKKDSIDVLLEAADLKAGRTRAVVAVGCLAERYGVTLAEALPEADAVLGFDAYPALPAHLRRVLDGASPPAHEPRDRRKLLPLAPAARHPTARPSCTPATPGGSKDAAPRGCFGATDAASTTSTTQAAASASLGGTASPPVRARLDARPWAPLKIASGCDRRCAFCAIPVFRGSFVSRPPADVVAEARWLAEQGVRELLLVSENTTSYGKDLGDRHLLEALLGQLAEVEGIARVRLSYLQPAEVRPALVAAIAGTARVAPYFDLSFQHASGAVLRRMRRFGDGSSFLRLLDEVRAAAPEAGIRSNVIVGFPGETERDLLELEAFLEAARLDAVGVFGYSDEDGTEAARLEGKLDAADIAERVSRVGSLVEQLTVQRAEERIGQRPLVLVDEVSSGRAVARAPFQGPDVDGVCLLDTADAVAAGDLVPTLVIGADGVDLRVVAR